MQFVGINRADYIMDVLLAKAARGSSNGPFKTNASIRVLVGAGDVR